MEKQTKNGWQSHHVLLGAGTFLAAVGLVTSLIFASTQAQTPEQDCAHAGGSWNASATPPCTMPGSGSGSGSTVQCPDGHGGMYTYNGTSCPPMQEVTCPNGVKHPSPYTCTPQENCASPRVWNGTACVDSGTPPPGGTVTCSSTQHKMVPDAQHTTEWCMEGTTHTTAGGTVNCTSTQHKMPADQYHTQEWCMDGTTHTTTGPTNQDPAKGCTDAGGTWDASRNFCQMPTCPQGQWWDGMKKSCQSSTTQTNQPPQPCPSGQYWDYGKNSCVQQMGGTQNPQEECLRSGGTWDAAKMPPCQMSGMPGGMQPGMYPPYGDSKCGPPPFCPFGHMPSGQNDANGCPVTKCNEPPAGFKGFGMNMPPMPTYPGHYRMGEGEGEQGQPSTMFQCPPGDVFCQKFSSQQDFSKFQFNIDQDAFSQVDQQFRSERELKQEGQRLKQEVKNVKQEARQIKEQLERIGKRTGVYCPAASDYSAALSTIETFISQAETAKTSDEIKAAVVLRDQVYGNPEDPTTGIFRKLHGYPDNDTGEFVPGLDQKIGQCEAAGHAIREIDRVLKQATQMLEKAKAKGADEALIAELEQWIADATALQTNPPADFFDAPDFDACGFGGGGFPGPMPPMGGRGPMPMPFEGGFPGGGEFPGGGFGHGGFPGGFPGGPGGSGGGFGGFSVPKEFEEQYKEQYEEYSKKFQSRAESTLVAQAGYPDFGDEEDFGPSEEELACMPGSARAMTQLMMRFGKLMRKVHEGLSSAGICGQIDQMFEMSGEFVDHPLYKKGIALLERGKAACEQDPPDVKTAQRIISQMNQLEERKGPRSLPGEEEEEDSGPKFGVDIDALIQEKLADLESEIEERIQGAVKQRMETLLEAFDSQARIIAALEEKISTLLTDIAKVVELDSSSERKLQQVIKAPEDVRDAIIEPVDAVVQVVQDQLEKVPESLEAVITPILEDHVNDVIQSSPTEATAELLAAQLDSTLTEVQTLADKPKEAKKILNEYVKNAEKVLNAIKPEDRITAGQTHFKDIAKDFEGQTKTWYFPVVEESFDRGIIKGTKDGDAQPNKTMSAGEAIVMVARGLELEPKEGATSVEGVNSEDAKWALPYAAAIDEKLREDGTTLAQVLEGRALNQPMPRIEVAEIVYHASDLAEPSAEVLAEVKADATLKGVSEAEFLAAAAVKEAGIITGKGEAGIFAGNDTMLKIEGAAVVQRTQDFTGLHVEGEVEAEAEVNVEE